MTSHKNYTYCIACGLSTIWAFRGSGTQEEEEEVEGEEEEGEQEVAEGMWKFRKNVFGYYLICQQNQEFLVKLF